MGSRPVHSISASRVAGLLLSCLCPPVERYRADGRVRYHTATSRPCRTSKEYCTLGR